MGDNHFEGYGTILYERLKFFGAVAACLLMDALFLILWGVLHYGLHWLAETPQAKELETKLVLALRIFLEAPIFIIILVFVIVDIIKIVKRIVRGAERDVRGN